MSSGLADLRDKIRLGGGLKRIEREHDRGKMTARERIEALIDDETAFLELGLFAGHGMYEEDGGCPAAGTVVGLGRVSGRLCIIVANDATVKAGAWFPITAKKNIRAGEMITVMYEYPLATTVSESLMQASPDKYKIKQNASVEKHLTQGFSKV